VSWRDPHGRTVGRHTTFFTSPAAPPAAAAAAAANASASAPGTSAATATAAAPPTIFAYGGKNSNIDGYMPFTYSTDRGATFATPGAKLPFPALGSNQRPCVHRPVNRFVTIRSISRFRFAKRNLCQISVLEEQPICHRLVGGVASQHKQRTPTILSDVAPKHLAG
jgi:hypothetical protein